MGNLKGTQTEKNILTAFAGESQARNRYTYFASQAKKDGYVQISEIFTETANQEKEHRHPQVVDPQQRGFCHTEVFYPQLPGNVEQFVVVGGQGGVGADQCEH